MAQKHGPGRIETLSYLIVAFTYLYFYKYCKIFMNYCIYFNATRTRQVFCFTMILFIILVSLSLFYAT